MFVRGLLVAVLVLSVGAGCTDNFAPRPSQQRVPHFIQWAPTAQPQFSATGAASAGMISSGGPIRFLVEPDATSGLSLTAYQATFWAVRGQSRTIDINYSAGGGTEPFLRLAITDPTYAPEQGDIAIGDSVLVTVTVDPNDIAVDLQPTGLLFGTPAQLKIWYGGANGDLNGDGVVDGTDATIESQLLGLWYQEGSGSPWSPMQATLSLSEKSFTAALQHFSGYAVSW